MANTVLEIQRTGDGRVAHGGKVVFDTLTKQIGGITFVAKGEGEEKDQGVITINEPGQYSVKWWVATETTPKGAIQFDLVLRNSQRIPGCSPIKTGQVSGFGIIDVTAPDTKLWLENQTEKHVVYSIKSNVKAYMLVNQIDTAYSGGLIGVYHTNLSASGSLLDVPVGKVIYRIQHASATTVAMNVRAASNSVVVDIKRSAQYDSSAEGQSLNNFSLTTNAQNLDSGIINISNEMHRTWIRQQDPATFLWSMYEVDLFVSKAGARVSVCVYLIYEDVDLSEL